MVKKTCFFVLGTALFLGLYLSGMSQDSGIKKSKYYLVFKNNPIELSIEGLNLSTEFKEALEIAKGERKDDEATFVPIKKKGEDYLFRLDSSVKNIAGLKGLQEKDIKKFAKLLDAFAQNPDDLEQIKALDGQALINQIWLADRFDVTKENNKGLLSALLTQYAKKVSPQIRESDYFNFFLGKPNIFSAIQKELPRSLIFYFLVQKPFLVQKLFYGDVVQIAEIWNNYSIDALEALQDENFVFGGGGGGRIQVWSSKTGKQIGKTIKTGSRVEGLSALPDGSFVSHHENGLLRIWKSKDQPDGKSIESLPVDKTIALPSTVKVSPSKSGKIFVYSKGKRIGETIKTENLVERVVVLPNECFVASYDTGVIRIWNPRPYKNLTLDEAILLKILILEKKKNSTIPSNVVESEKFKEAYERLLEKAPWASRLLDRSGKEEIDIEYFSDDDSDEEEDEGEEIIEF